MRGRGVVVALAAVLLCSGCSSAPAPVPSASTTPPAPTPTATAAPSGPPLTVAVVGDSLSRGYDACDRYGDCPAVSWAGGTDGRVDSIASRLSARTGRAVRVRDVARSGVSADDLDRQVAAAVGARPDLVTILIGANDVCRASVGAMTPAADYASAVQRAVTTISRRTSAVVLLASAPDPAALLDAAAEDPTARFLWQHGRICPTALADPRSSAPDAVARRTAVTARIAAYDRALAGICSTAPRCVFDGGALRTYRPTLRQLSALDAFHPSVAGQRELARLEWAALARSARAGRLLD